MRGDFLDTNILFYAADNPGPKVERADALIRDGGTISVQVLNELAVNAHRKLHQDWPTITRFLDGLTTFLNVEPLDHQTHRDAISLIQRYKLSFWDALIVATALKAGCSRLMSEDMQHGLRIDNRLTITNPFLGH